MTVAPTLFGLIRHGQTDYNLADRFQGSSDIPLNATGREQAHHALDLVPDLGWDRLVSSPLSRARETAAIIGADHGIELGEADPQLSEIDWGAAEGVDVNEAEARWPHRSFPGRESSRQVLDRALAALSDLAEAHPGERILVVAHGTLIRLVLTGITGVALPSIPNGTLSVVEVGTQDPDRDDDTLWSVQMIAGRPYADSPHLTIHELAVDDAHLIPAAPPASAATKESVR